MKAHQNANRVETFILVGIVLVVVLVLVVITVAVPAIFGKPDGPGAFGDMFGLANALFSGLAFAGVIFAILLQRQELALQREELQETREEMRRARLEAERTARANESATRLTVLTQLITHHREQYAHFDTLAFGPADPAVPESHFGRTIVNEDAAGSYKHHFLEYLDLVNELAVLRIALSKSSEAVAEPGAAPNGSPAMQPGNSGVTEGPPSVS
ncbi:MAG: hypothetical protein RIS76_2977 [Verrucomicrobiota bacterium]|jgi:uncharacterized membrane protein